MFIETKRLFFCKQIERKIFFKNQQKIRKKIRFKMPSFYPYSLPATVLIFNFDHTLYICMFLMKITRHSKGCIFIILPERKSSPNHCYINCYLPTTVCNVKLTLLLRENCTWLYLNSKPFTFF